ncbi:MAG: hypothetical protein M0026_13725 [Nocardiopsaceae bacterium]|nr:hypothetical protein [Nocardiopsaceae bacterium]
MSVTLNPVTLTIPDHRFDPRWNRITGMSVEGDTITIEPEKYFFRLESDAWRVIEWDKVVTELLHVNETSESAIEQIALEYIAQNSHITNDPAEVLSIAWQVYSYLFREEHLASLGIDGITADHLRMLAEVSTFTALNKVEDDGQISIVGPTWFFADTAQVIYDLDEPTTELLDEVFHGAWFNEYRRIEGVKAHAALGGRLVHGCQSAPDRRGGVVAPYGTNMKRFRDELDSFRDTWLTTVQSYGEQS